MDFELPPEDDPRRLGIRAWLEQNPNPSGKVLAEAGYVVPHWPRPWGLDADPLQDISAVERVALVMAGGRVFEPSSLPLLSARPD